MKHALIASIVLATSLPVLAQKLPSEISAEKTCALIQNYYTQEDRRIKKENFKLTQECEKARNNLPKDQRKHVQCVQYIHQDQSKYVSAFEFKQQCVLLLRNYGKRPSEFFNFTFEDCVTMGMCSR